MTKKLTTIDLKGKAYRMELYATGAREHDEKRQGEAFISERKDRQFDHCNKISQLIALWLALMDLVSITC